MPHDRRRRLEAGEREKRRPTPHPRPATQPVNLEKRFAPLFEAQERAAKKKRAEAFQGLRGQAFSPAEGGFSRLEPETPKRIPAKDFTPLPFSKNKEQVGQRLSFETIFDKIREDKPDLNPSGIINRFLEKLTEGGKDLRKIFGREGGDVSEFLERENIPLDIGRLITEGGFLAPTVGVGIARKGIDIVKKGKSLKDITLEGVRKRAGEARLADKAAAADKLLNEAKRVGAPITIKEAEATVAKGVGTRTTLSKSGLPKAAKGLSESEAAQLDNIALGKYHRELRAKGKFTETTAKFKGEKISALDFTPDPNTGSLPVQTLTALEKAIILKPRVGFLSQIKNDFLSRQLLTRILLTGGFVGTIGFIIDSYYSSKGFGIFTISEGTQALSLAIFELKKLDTPEALDMAGEIVDAALEFTTEEKIEKLNSLFPGQIKIKASKSRLEQDRIKLIADKYIINEQRDQLINGTPFELRLLQRQIDRFVAEETDRALDLENSQAMADIWAAMRAEERRLFREERAAQRAEDAAVWAIINSDRGRRRRL